MTKKYIHFTDHAGAEAILDSKVLWQSSYGPAGAVFAVVEGGAWVPSVQLSSMGRAKNRNYGIVFTTDFLPDYAMPEEVMWHLPKLPIKVVDIFNLAESKIFLDDSIPQVGEFKFLAIPLHPAFNDFGDWTRMPETFDPWLPGKDDQKYFTARKIWLDTKDIKAVEKFWNEQTQKENLVPIIKHVLKEILKFYR